MSDLKGKFVKLFDGIFFTVLIFFTLAIMVGGYYLDAHPVFYVVSILIIIFTIIISATFGNVFYEVTGVEEIESEASEFTLLPFIMNNFVIIILTLSFLIVIVMYAKKRSETL